MKNIKIGIGLLGILIVLIGIKFLIPIFLPITIKTNTEYSKGSHREEILYDFIVNKLSNEDGGIKTNYLNNKNEGDITKGDSVLSESEGLMLLYYLEKNDENGFNKTLNYIDTHMMLENGLVSWRVDLNKKSEVSSTIDDLRIIRALLLAGEKWDSLSYRYQALKMANSLYSNMRNESMLEDYKGSNITTLSYIDIETLEYLSEIDFKWKYILKQSEEILNKGFISNELPLYRQYYDRKTKKYDDLDYVNTLLSTIVILNKAKSGQNVTQSVEWFNNQFKKNGAIYAEYYIKNGMHKGQVQSTAIYANLVEIARITKNNELYKYSISKMKDFQVLDKKSKIYGSFGNEKNLEVYSFDNLNALLAFRVLEN